MGELPLIEASSDEKFQPGIEGCSPLREKGKAPATKCKTRPSWLR